MNEMHRNNNLYNDIFLNHILLDFPTNELLVYMEVIDWNMATKSMEQMKLLYTFSKAQTMTQTLAEKWWVDPKVAYLHRRDADVEIIPLLSKPLEEYAIAKLVAKINRENMSEDYHKLQREGNNSSMVLSMSDLAGVFHQYLNCL
jgi:hypothetical protein